jgi:hypothetical protein
VNHRIKQSHAFLDIGGDSASGDQLAALAHRTLGKVATMALAAFREQTGKAAAFCIPLL